MISRKQCLIRMETSILLFVFLLTSINYLQSQTLDTLVDVGGYKLHFNIIKGEGTPILFESGNSFKGTPWNGTLKLIHKITGATIITYDRSGFGKSELNPNETDASKFGINNNMKELDIALTKLGYIDEFVLVGHSIGALYTSLFAARHAEKIKGIVLLNGHLPGYWTKERLAKSPPPNKTKLKLNSYYLRVNFADMIDTVRDAGIPLSIPVIDVVAGIPLFFMDDDDFNDWKMAHKEFADRNKNIQGIVAHGSGHYLFKSNEVLFLNTITKIYAETLPVEQKIKVLNRGINMSIERVNLAKKEQMEYLNSELNLNQFSNRLIKNEELDKALKVLKLNIILFPNSWRTYKNYADILLKFQQTKEAVKMYEKSIQINPNNEQIKRILENLKLEKSNNE